MYIAQEFKSVIPFDEDGLVRCHPIKVLPLVVGIILDTQGFTLAIWVHQCNWEHIVLRVDTSVVAEGEGPVDGGVRNWSPKIYDLESTFEQGRSFLSWKVAVNTSNCGWSGLIDVRLGDGLTLLSVRINFSRSTTAKGYEYK